MGFLCLDLSFFVSCFVDHCLSFCPFWNLQTFLLVEFLLVYIADIYTDDTFYMLRVSERLLFNANSAILILQVNIQ